MILLFYLVKQQMKKFQKITDPNLKDYFSSLIEFGTGSMIGKKKLIERKGKRLSLSLSLQSLFPFFPSSRFRRGR